MNKIFYWKKKLKKRKLNNLNIMNQQKNQIIKLFLEE